MAGTILIVDDEVHIRMLLVQALEDLEDAHGVRILTASNGVEGLESIRANRPDLVFLDIMMPRMNGYEVCEAVTRDRELRSRVRIILLTAKGQETDRRQGLESGAGQYMTKPFDPDEVVAVARRVLGLPG